MAEPQKKAKSDIKSGVDRDSYVSQVIGGEPPKKDVEQIEKANTPGKFAGSTSR